MDVALVLANGIRCCYVRKKAAIISLRSAVLDEILGCAQDDVNDD